ncbi:hypothetical protein SAY87_015427 [Trapa incisa]|uniref:HMA domain-containing protein n=1 Tax=Trapa incisa TaxID=236973 RepID=A0AAN7GLN0_9MYRT|nr:hypothetical protein SAY87_015427 [Trapa incisa]
MSHQRGNMKNQICVLRVNIHCEGCKKKVKKLLQKIEGVDGTLIDADQGKVTVSGYVHPNVLIKKLSKSGKHAELWTAAKNSLYAVQNRPDKNQFHDLQFDRLTKPQKGGNDGYTKDLRMANMGHKPKAPKSVKFDLTDDEFHGGSDGEFSQPEDGGKAGFELDFGRRPPARTPTRGGSGQHGQKEKKKVADGAVKEGKDGSGKAKKKRGFFIFRFLFFRGFGRKKKSKTSSDKKKGDGGGAKEGGQKQGAIEFKNGGKNGGWVVENCKNGGKAMAVAKNSVSNFKGEHNPMNGGGGGGGKNSRASGVGKPSDFQEIDLGNLRKGGTPAAGGGNGGYRDGAFAGRVCPIGNYPTGPMGNYQMSQFYNNNNVGPMGPMGPIGPMSNNAVGQMGQYSGVSQMGSMGNYQPAHALPAPAPASMNGGYYHGMGPMNHQYTAMMMSQPPYVQPNGMFHPMMHGRPSPMRGYAPHRASDGYTNMFNDENTESCSIM